MDVIPDNKGSFHLNESHVLSKMILALVDAEPRHFDYAASKQVKFSVTGEFKRI